MRLYTFVFLVLMSVSVTAKTLVVAVIDTGISKDMPHLCPFGHKSFVPPTFGSGGNRLPDPLNPVQDHGTHIVGLINHNVGSKGDYCILSLQFYVKAGTGNAGTISDAIRYAVDIGVDFINISAGGASFSREEYRQVERALDQRIVFVTVAGNDGRNLDQDCYFYPACYDKRIVVVGSVASTKEHRCADLDSNEFPGGNVTHSQFPHSPSSNYGTVVNRWEVGTICKSTVLNGEVGYKSGTSQAAAVATGKLLRERLNSMSK
jgi:subtilisin family serine protease